MVEQKTRWRRQRRCGTVGIVVAAVAYFPPGSSGMAHIRVVRHEAEQGLLPLVCVVCGAASKETVSRKFGWQSKWRVLCGVLLLIPVGFFRLGLTEYSLDSLFQISPRVAFVTGLSVISLAVYLILWGWHTIQVRLPVCETHLQYWASSEKRTAALVFLAAMVTCVIGLLATTAAPMIVIVSVGIGLTILLLLLSITISVMQFVNMRPTQIDEQSIILKNVSDGFATAVAEAHLDRPPVMAVDSERIQAAVPETSGTPEAIEPPDQRIQPRSP
jgi:hypothetical protein